MTKIEKLAIEVLNKPSGTHILNIPGVMELNDDEMLELSKEIENKKLNFTK